MDGGKAGTAAEPGEQPPPLRRRLLVRKRTTTSMYSTTMLNPFSKGQKQRWQESAAWGGGKSGGKECSSEEHRTPRAWQVPGMAKAKWAGVSLELSRTAELGGVAKEIRII